MSTCFKTRTSLEEDGAASVWMAWQRISINNHFRDKRIVVVDLDEPNNRVRSVYEDIDEESASNQRNCLLTMFPERAEAAAKGDDKTGIFVMTHHQACEDIRKMIRHGYTVTVVERERQVQS